MLTGIWNAAIWSTLGLVLTTIAMQAAEQKLVSPGSGLTIVVSDDHGLAFRVEAQGKTIVTSSPLGLEFEGGVNLGPEAVITRTVRARHDGQWENLFGANRVVRDRWREMHLTLEEPGPPRRTFGLIVRAYDDGVAFRYELPESTGLGRFVLTNELTEFRFLKDYRCWAGGESPATEARYGESRISAIPSGKPGQPFRSILPLLVETPAGYLAISESDLLDWAGMSVTGTGTTAVKVTLDSRADGQRVVVSSAPRVSPWRVLMYGRTAAALAGSNLIATLATPSRLQDTSWVKAGACAWDPWWTGKNPYDPDPSHTAVLARGTTAADKEYIDLAAEMGWPYQLMDWFWYKNMTLYSKSLQSTPNPELPDFTQSDPAINIRELVQYAKSKNVRLFIWAHSLDVETFGVEKALAYFAEQGFAGVKIDFVNSQSQEAVQWCEKVLATEARHHLMIDFHGMYKPTGMARTYPNFITQEGVLGNEYNKLPGNQCTLLHTITLPFTRALLGPMDFTPGGFLNRPPKDFRIAVPAEVMGTRSRQLAMTVIYPSPLTVMCDSPMNYRGQAGLEFLRGIPTVWDESVVLSGEVAKSIVVARRSGERWYVAAMNGGDSAQLQAPLRFLGKGRWTLRSFADKADSSDYEAAVESTRDVDAKSVLPVSLAPGGGFAGIISKAK